MDSWLGERLKVLVPVELGDLEPRRVQVRLLKADEYEALDLAPAHPFLKHLTAGWSEATGPLTIRIRSQRPNPEPLLTIAVEVVTPSLRVIRHVSLLFDPRPAADQPAERAQAPARKSSEESAPQRPPASSPAAKPATAAAQTRAAKPDRPTAPKPSTNKHTSTKPAAVGLPRFQLTYALRELPPQKVPEPPAAASLGNLSAALASTTSQHAANAATATSAPPSANTTLAQPQIDQAADTPKMAAGPAPAVEQPETKARTQASAPEPAAGDAVSVGRILWALLPAVLAAILWALLWQRVRPKPPHRHPASTAPTPDGAKVTPISAGRPLTGSTAPALRAANE